MIERVSQMCSGSPNLGGRVESSKPRFCGASPGLRRLSPATKLLHRSEVRSSEEANVISVVQIRGDHVRLNLVCLLLGTAIVARSIEFVRAQPPEKRDRDLQGRWQLVAARENGEDVAKEIIAGEQKVLILSRLSYELWSGKTKVFDGDWTCNRAKQPFSIS
jgi:hypothetical protein